MPEIRNSFAASHEWLAFRNTLGDLNAVASSVLNDVSGFGIVEPFTGIRRAPHEILIRAPALRESISSHELNSRKRALLLQLYLELRFRGSLDNRRLKILAADGITRASMILRGQYPLYLGSEYIPSEKDQETYFPIPHVDLQSIKYKDNCFDVFFSGDVFEHIPDLHAATLEIHRVLKPGGLLVSSFPFDPSRNDTIIRAKLSKDGNIKHLMEPEYHGNPVDPEGGALVYSLPGWDFLSELRKIGFSHAQYRYLVSSRYGVASEDTGGIFTLVAQKSDVTNERAFNIPKFSYLGELPRKLVTLVGLPRSGTTLLTSIFSVHSDFEAIYEPWNAGRLAAEDNVSLIDLIQKENIDSISNKVLFVKETASKLFHVKYIQRLLKNTPFPIERHSIVILRRPDQIYLSEIARRSEWWGDDVVISQRSFDDWCKKSQQSVSVMLDLLNFKESTILSLETLSEHPESTIKNLSDRLGVSVQPNQFAYQDNLDKSRVRGDKNVSQQPKAVDKQLALSREDQAELVQKFAMNSAHRTWFENLCNLHKYVSRSGGIMGGRDLPVELGEPLIEPKDSPNP